MEQRRIFEAADRRLSITESIQAQVEADTKRQERLRQSILSKAFSGQLVPQNPADEPASILLERIRAERAKHPRHAAARNSKQKPKTARQRGAK